MFNLISVVIDSTSWFFTTGWKIWSSLFSALPYGDPYIAIAAALMLAYVTHKTLHPGNQTL